MVHKRRFVVFFFFFFSKTKSFASKTSEKRKCPPVSYIHTYFLSRVFLPTLFFSFLAAAGASQGRSLPFLFCFFLPRRTKERHFWSPQKKKRLEETKEQKQKTNLPRARFERSRSDRIV